MVRFPRERNSSEVYVPDLETALEWAARGPVDAVEDRVNFQPMMCDHIMNAYNIIEVTPHDAYGRVNFISGPKLARD